MLETLILLDTAPPDKPPEGEFHGGLASARSTGPVKTSSATRIPSSRASPCRPGRPLPAHGSWRWGLMPSVMVRTRTRQILAIRLMTSPIAPATHEVRQRRLTAAKRRFGTSDAVASSSFPSLYSSFWQLALL